jgi:hypothetical protein
MTAIKGTNLAAPVVPFDSNDTYPTHDEQYGLGGYRTVADQTARNAIPAERRVQGMLVYSIADDVTYQLQEDLTTWGTFNAGGGGGNGRYDVGVFFPDKPGDGQVIAMLQMVIAVRVLENFSGCRFLLGTPPTANTTFSVQKNGTTFGTIVFHPTGDPTVSATETDFNEGDLFAVLNQSPADATAALPSFTFALTTL